METLPNGLILIKTEYEKIKKLVVSWYQTLVYWRQIGFIGGTPVRLALSWFVVLKKNLVRRTAGTPVIRKEEKCSANQ
jgi:hypothetical protein